MKTSTLLPTTLLILCLAFVTSQAGGGFFSAAMAQDGDDDDDDDDDDGGGDDSDAGGDDGGDDDASADGERTDSRDDDRAGPGPSAPPRLTPRVATRAELPRFVPGELVTLSLSEADLAVLLTRGYRVLEERPVLQLDAISRRLAVPGDISLEAARDEVRALATGANADFNHYYRSEQSTEPAACEGPHCASFDLIGWNSSAGMPCAADIVVGVIDTGINPDHPTFASARLEVHKLTPGDLDPSRAIHGTAVTALLIGDPDSRSPGLLPGARVVAVDAFHTDGGDERADVYTLVTAMDFLAAKGVRVVNMSLAGPPNVVLERTVEKLSERDMLLVAATGNAGPEAEPAYPAAYAAVVAVTAVDRAGTVYRRAGRGEHVDLAAPGVEIWTAASVKGARPKTGTSFAAPFVSATAAAYLAANPGLSAQELAALLAASATDLGAPGHDEIYGHGLVQAGPSCVADKGLQDP